MSSENKDALAEYKAKTDELAEKVKKFDNFSEDIKSVQDHVDQIEKNYQKQQAGGKLEGLSYKGQLRTELHGLFEKDEVVHALQNKTANSKFQD